MAKPKSLKKIKTKKEKLKTNKVRDFVARKSALKIVTEGYFKYGSYVIENRALPDFRDGLKPVQRRILYYMMTKDYNSKKDFVKCSKIAGPTTGEYHPHGQTSAYGALVTMAHKWSYSVPLIEGSGNFGNYAKDSPGADRYTSARMSKFSDKYLLDKDYMAVVPKVGTYDNAKEEPLFLPALLPNLLFNGVQGIAVGVSVNIPPFEPKGVIELVKQKLGGEKITVKDCLKHLKFNWRHGSHCVSEKEKLKEYYETGKGSIVFECDHTVDHKNNCVVLTSVLPNSNPETMFTRLSEKIPAVQSVRDLSSNKTGILIKINFKRGTDIHEAVKKVIPAIRSSEGFATNITIRDISDEGIKEGIAEFKRTTIPGFINAWCNWRVKFEVEMLKDQLDKRRYELHRNEVLRYAIDHLDKIFKVLKSKTKDLDGDLAKALNISVEDAKIVLSLQVRSLSNLEAAEIDKKITNIKGIINSLKKDIKAPQKRILEFIDKIDFKEISWRSMTTI